MDASKYWKYQTAIAGIMGFLLGIGFQQDNTILVVLTFIIGISSLLYLRRHVDKPLHDERSSLISTKASAATFSAFTLGSLAVATIPPQAGIPSAKWSWSNKLLQFLADTSDARGY